MRTIKESRTLKFWACAVMLAISFCVFYAVVQRPASDLSIHATWASEGDFLHPRSFLHHGAHPLWHVLTAAVMLTGLSLNASAALVTALLKAAETWLLIGLCERLTERRGWLPVLAGVCAALVTAVCVPWYNPTVYAGVGSPNTWHSPTQLFAVVMMLICVPLTAKCLDKFNERLPQDGAKANVPWKDVLWLAALLLLSLVAKPTFMQAFLPATCLYFLWFWAKHPKNSAFVVRMMAAALPSVLFMVLQYLYYFGIIVPSQGDMVVLVTWSKAREVLVSVLLTRLFPLFVLMFCLPKGTLRKPLFSLTLCMDAVSILEMLLLSETGRRASDGNFGWAMMGSALMLWALTLPMFVRGLKERGKQEMWKTVVGGGLLAWHLGSGVYYLVYLMSTTNAL